MIWWRDRGRESGSKKNKKVLQSEQMCDKIKANKNLETLFAFALSHFVFMDLYGSL